MQNQRGLKSGADRSAREPKTRPWVDVGVMVSMIRVRDVMNRNRVLG